jgi:restriction endonuclease Mrr
MQGLVKHGLKVRKGYIVTTSTFTAEALEWGKGKPITFLDGKELVGKQVDRENKPASRGKTSANQKKRAPDRPLKSKVARKRPGRFDLRRLFKKKE